MSLPDRATKHIPKPQESIGAKKNGKIKVIDGRTGKESWRQGTKGFVKDYDGDPIAVNHTAGNAKKSPHHSPRMAVKHKSHRARLGGGPTHQAGQSSADSDE
jgi:hypothetical protein